jgi:adenosylhomocysteinase
MHVKDLDLAPQGHAKIAWNETDMPVLVAIRRRFEREQPLKGLRIAACLHVTAKTAALVRTLKAGGADIVLAASNPLSTQDDVAAALVVADEIPVYAIKGEDTATYYQHLNAALDHRPHITLDDGCDLVSLLHRERAAQVAEVRCGTEETTTGVQRLRAMERRGALRYPVLAVNDSMTKHFFDNRYGTGQSALDGVIRATNLLIAGRTVVVCGYGWCGRGVAARAHGLGAHVIVTEVDEMRALEAVMDGFRVLPLAKAAREGDLFLTVTGNKHVIGARHLRLMKDGAILANAGHFNVEIDLPGLRALCPADPREVRPLVEEYVRADGRRTYVLAGGRLVNLAAGEGHPPAIMDMSFANQALGVEYMLRSHAQLRPGVHTIPESIDREIARLKLATLGVAIDRLSPAQRRYLSSWEEGT